MKPLYIIVVCVVMFPARLWGATITAINNGNWTNNATWSCNCQPTNSDNIVIPTGRTVTANGPVILFLGPVITITISGALVLNNASLQIDGTDIVNIASGGSISGSGIFGGAVYSGVTPIFISNGGTINGPKVIAGGVLPITLLYFKTSVIDEGILIEWASGAEENLEHYEIARSEDGYSFVSIATLTAKSEKGGSYSFVDASPSNGMNFYRLTAVDRDGSRHEMEVAKSEWTGTEDWITLYPNPVTDGTLHALFQRGESGSFRLLDCNGIAVAESSFGNASACNLQIPTGQSPGIYFVYAEMNGRTARIKVLIK